MQPEHLAFSIKGQRNETILTNRDLLSLNATASFYDTTSFGSAINTTEVDQGTASTGRKSRHLDQRTWHPCVFPADREHLRFDFRTVRLLQFRLQDSLMEPLRSLHVLHIDFKPTDGIA